MATSGTTKKLYMVWKLSNGKNLTVAIMDPKEDIDSSDIAPVMQQAVTNNVFLVGTATVTEAEDAYIRTVETLDLNPEGV